MFTTKIFYGSATGQAAIWANKRGAIVTGVPGRLVIQVKSNQQIVFALMM
jgi:hypothetical protein